MYKFQQLLGLEYFCGKEIIIYIYFHFLQKISKFLNVDNT